jgi:hypothetical protein
MPGELKKAICSIIETPYGFIYDVLALIQVSASGEAGAWERGHPARNTSERDARAPRMWQKL